MKGTELSDAHAGARQPALICVFDIDGVLADVAHRLVHLASTPKNWDAFFAAAADDTVLSDGLTAVKAAQEREEAIIYLSGRPERLRRVTTLWLAAGGFPAAPVHLRPDRDRRPARLFKPEVLAQLGGPAAISAVYDDDDAVVQALRAQGYPVTQVTWANSAGALTGVLQDAQETTGRT